MSEIIRLTVGRLRLRLYVLTSDLMSQVFQALVDIGDAEL